MTGRWYEKFRWRPRPLRAPGLVDEQATSRFSSLQGPPAAYLMPRRPSALPAGLAASKARLMGAILEREDCRTALVRFLESEFNAEAVAFWEAVEDFRESPPADAAARARLVAGKFVAAGAPLEINVGAGLRARTLAAVDALRAATDSRGDALRGKAAAVLGVASDDERASALRDCRRAARRGSGAPWARVFDAAQAEVERALECDALDRFLESVHGRFAALALRDPNGTFFEGDVLVRVHRLRRCEREKRV